MGDEAYSQYDLQQAFDNFDYLILTIEYLLENHSHDPKDDDQDTLLSLVAAKSDTPRETGLISKEDAATIPEDYIRDFYSLSECQSRVLNI